MLLVNRERILLLELLSLVKVVWQLMKISALLSFLLLLLLLSLWIDGGLWLGLVRQTWFGITQAMTLVNGFCCVWKHII